MDKSSTDKLSKVHPELAKRVERVIADLASRGMDVRVVQGLRTYKEQNDLYAQGRSKPGQIVTNAIGGQSNHNFGLAVDLCPFNASGKPDWNNNAGFTAIGQAGINRHLSWGGSWKKFIDKPHLELSTGLTTAQCRTLFEKGGLKAVWDRASTLINSTATDSADSGEVNIVKPASPATSASSSPSILKQGSVGQEVRNLQKALGITVDGDYGQKTYDAVVKFQRAKNLYVDGRVGNETRKALGI